MDLVFPDLHILLSALDAYLSGYDVIKENPFCHYNIPHVYSRAWFVFQYIGFSDNYRFEIGILILILTSSTVALLSRKKEIRLLIFACSPAIMLAIERCNNDLIIFILLPLVCFFALSDKKILVILGHCLLFFATCLKYYPVAFSIIFLFRKGAFSINLKHIIVQIILFFLLITVIWQDLQFQRNTLPEPGYTWAFGFSAFKSMIIDILRLNEISGMAIIGFFTLIFVIMFTNLYKNELKLRSNIIIPNPYKTALCAGGIMIMLFCYFVKTSFDYRMIFLFLSLPLLLDYKLGNNNSLRNLILAPVMIFLLLTLSSWFEAIREWGTIIISSTWSEILPISLYIIRALELFINHISFSALLAFAIFLIIKSNQDAQEKFD